jgi:hypothetical protein
VITHVLALKRGAATLFLSKIRGSVDDGVVHQKNKGGGQRGGGKIRRTAKERHRRSSEQSNQRHRRDGIRIKLFLLVVTQKKDNYCNANKEHSNVHHLFQHARAYMPF